MSRTRSKLLNPVVLSTTAHQRNKKPDGSWNAWLTPATANGNTFRQNSQVMVDQKTPGYFKAVREGGIIPCSPMDSTKEEFIWTPGNCQAVFKQSSSTYQQYEVDINGFFWPADNPYAVKPADPVVDGNIALQEALSRAQSDCYDALTFAAEFRKTVEGVVTLRTRAMTLWARFDERVRTSAKKKRYRGMEVSQILAEIWLELRYMWRPLVYDMMSAQEAIRRLAEGIEDPLQRAYATVEGSVSSSRVVTTGTIAYKDGARGGISPVRVYSAQTCTVTRTAHASVGLQVTTRDVYMTDPFVTGWELVPFSFVLDWFITVGSMLTAFSPFATGQLRYATLAVTTVSTYRSINAIQAGTGFSVITYDGNPCVCEKIITEYKRTLATPVPTLAVDINLNIAKVLDLLALWGTINRKSLTRLLRHF